MQSAAPYSCPHGAGHVGGGTAQGEGRMVAVVPRGAAAGVPGASIESQMGEESIYLLTEGDLIAH